MRSMNPRHSEGPIIDMTPEGEFRDQRSPLRQMADRLMGRFGGVALLVALAGFGIVVAAVMIALAVLALPVAILAASIASASLWWRLRRLRRQAGGRVVLYR